MLAEFAFSGYRSFRERCVFSMKAEARSENSDSLIDGKYLPVSVLYGPDGSGKSSVINAVRAVAESVSLPLLSSGSGIGALCAPFAGTALPSFMMEYTSGDSIYRYSIAASNDEIISESLERKGGDEKRFSLLFSRDSDDIRYHGLFRSIGAGEVPSDVPLLTILASEHPENAIVTEAYRGIADGFTFPSANDSFDVSDKVLVSIVRELGLGIEDVISKDGRTGLSYGSYSVPLSEESQGIQEIFALLPSVMRALRSGSTLLLDSPLPTVHPAVLEYIIHLFTEKESNVRGASLVFSTNAVSIMDIRNFRRDEIWLAERKDGREIVYDPQARGYRLTRCASRTLTSSEVLAVCKILLDSRSMVKEEMFPILDKLVECAVPAQNQKLVDELIANEAFHYIPPHHDKPILGSLWALGEAVRYQRVVEIEYARLKGRETVTRRIQPVGIMFSEYYFYLTAFLEDKSHFENPGDLFPTIYRIDRIVSFQVLDEHFRVPYRDRFEEGEFRKRVQFMYGGRLQHIKFRYTGPSIEAVLNRLPTAKIIEQDEEGWTVEAEVFGKGIEMWVRSQGEYVKCIETNEG